ncbi:MAG: 4Fe-4S dicluster domain-containing protein [Peptococcaceae bacterium]|nr:4Fe-4S dicluster domain-containing protein [Peptococcaceae bacterium]
MAGEVMPVDWQRDLSDRLVSLGVTLVGYGDVSRGLAGELRHLDKAVSLAVAHPSGGGNVVSSGGVTAYCNQMADVDQRLERVQGWLVRYLKSRGWRTLAIPPDSLRRDSRFIARIYPLFPHKTAATCAGLGWVGKSGLLINERYGPLLSLATVLTNAPLAVCQSPLWSGRCGKCRRCVDGCPVQAIPDREWSSAGPAGQIDVQACTGRLTANREKTGRAICGLCILACPYTGKITRRPFAREDPPPGQGPRRAGSMAL